jgi:hypothetical protein
VITFAEMRWVKLLKAMLLYKYLLKNENINIFGEALFLAIESFLGS